MSLNIDTTVLFAIVQDIFNGFWPVIVLVVGFPLAFGIMRFISKSIKSAV